MRCTITCKQETETHHCEIEISMTLIGWLILKSIKTTSTDSCFHVSLRKLSAHSKKAFYHSNIKCFCQHFTVKKEECIAEISF